MTGVFDRHGKTPAHQLHLVSSREGKTVIDHERDTLRDSGSPVPERSRSGQAASMR